jgi:hypothetical protein
MDFREAILARLVAVAEGISPAFATVERNAVVLADTKLPALIVLDGEEEADERDPDRRPANAPRRVKMRAVLQIQLQDLPENAGTDLNGFRKALINAIFTDTTLLSYTIDNRSIRYLGCNTGFDMGRQLEATMWLHIEFGYPLFPGAI